MLKKTLGLLIFTLALATFFVRPAFAAGSTQPASADITVTNNLAGTPDTVTVDNLNSDDVVYIYNSSASSTPIGVAVATGGDATVYIGQLGSAAGNVYVSVTTGTNAESTRAVKAYPAESQTSAPNAAYITVTNNVRNVDSITVGKVASGDIINVYSAALAVSPIATIVSADTAATCYVSQLGASAGSVYVSVTNADKLESARTAKTYSAESSSTAPAPANITVVNNLTGTSDTVLVSGLALGDIINVYSTATGGASLGSAAVTSGTSATATITQIGAPAGNAYVTVTSTGKRESTRSVKAYSAEPTTQTLSAASITVVNNFTGTPDTITVSGLKSGDVVKAYSASTGGTLLGTSPAVTNTSASVTVAQLGSGAGTVYVSLTTSGKIEGARTAKAYSSETKSKAPLGANISILNNSAGTADTVTVSSLTAGDVVRVYSASSVGTLLGTSDAVTDTSGTVTINQLGTGAGNVYVTVTSTNMLESTRTAKAYSTEPTTASSSLSNITVTNNLAGTPDTVRVSGLSLGDVVKVYVNGNSGSAIGSASVTSGTEAVVSITQLGTRAGRIYVSVTSAGKLESFRTECKYTSETSAAPTAANVKVTNNPAGTSDSLTVSGLLANDVVKVYSAATGGTVLGTSMSANGTTATVTIDQLGESSGTVYISVTSSGKLESARTAITCSSEPTTAAPTVSAITATNNLTGMTDTVVVTGLSVGDIVNVYSAASGGTDIGSAPVVIGNSVTVYITQLGTANGTVYVTNTTGSLLESARTAVPFTSETTAAPLASNITIVNNISSLADTVTVYGLKVGDIVNVYNVKAAGTTIGTSPAVEIGSSSVTVSISQLGASAGNVYVTVTNTNKLESDRTLAAFPAEPTGATISNDSATLGLVGVTTSSSSASVAAATISNGSIIFSAVNKGSATITVSDSSGHTAKIAISVSSTKQITVGTITKYVSAFKAVTNSTVSNSSTTLGLTGVFAYTDNTSVATAEISNGNIAITSVSAGSANVTVTDTNGNTATIPVTVAANGTITLGSISIYNPTALVTFSMTTPVNNGSTNTFTTSGTYNEADVLIGTTSIVISAVKTANQTITIENKYDPMNVTSVGGTSTNPIYTIDTTIGWDAGHSGGTKDIYLLVSEKGKTIVEYRIHIWVTNGSFTSVANSSTANNIATLGLVGVSALSADTSVATASISGGNVEITSVDVGTTTITVTDASNHTVSIPVTVTPTGSVTIGSITKYTATFASTTDSSYANDVSTLGVYATAVSSSDTGVVTVLLIKGKLQVVSKSVGSATITAADASGHSASIPVTVALDGSITYGTITKYSAVFASTTDTSVSNNVATLGIVGAGGNSYTMSDDSSVATPAIVNGKVAVTSVGPGTTNLWIYDQYNCRACIQVTVSAEGSITIDNIVKYVFTSTTDNSLSNDTATLGLVGTSVVSDTPAVATAQIVSGKILITSKSAGETTLYITSGANTATALIYVDCDGVINFYDITKYADVTAPTLSSVGTSVTIGNTLAAKSSEDGTIYLVLKTAARTTKSNLEAAVAAGTATKVTATAGVLAALPTAGLSAGTYVVEAVDATGNVSAASASVTVSVASALTSGQITLKTVTGAYDTLKLTGLSTGDVIKVYDAASGGNSVAGTLGTISGGAATFTFTADLGSSGKSIWVTVTSTGKSESARVAVVAQSETNIPVDILAGGTIYRDTAFGSSVQITYTSSNTLQITGLDSDILVSSTGFATNLSAAAASTLAVGSSIGTLALPATVTLTFNDSRGTSTRPISFTLNKALSVLASYQITLYTVTGAYDYLNFTGLSTGDTVKVYDAATGGSSVSGSLGTITSGKATFSLSSDLGASGKNIWVTVTSTGKLESSRVAVAAVPEFTLPADILAGGTLKLDVAFGSTMQILYTDAPGYQIMRFLTLPAEYIVNSTGLVVNIVNGQGGVYASNGFLVGTNTRPRTITLTFTNDDNASTRPITFTLSN